MTSPTERTLKLLRETGYRAEVCEKWNQFAGVRKDLFDFMDIVAVRGSTKEIVGVQATSTPNVPARIKKIRALSAHKEWLAAGGRILVIGWAKRGPAGKRKLWTPRIVELTADDETEVAA